MDDKHGDIDLKGKDFDEVCELIKGDEVAGSVNRRPDGGGAGRWSHCFSFTPTEFSEAELLDVIAAEFGPGTYPVQFKSTERGARPVIRWHKDMTVQARRLGAQPSTPAPTLSPAPSTANDALAVALSSIADTQSRILDALNRRPEPEQKSTIDFAKELAVLKDLFTDNRQGMLETFRDAMELRKLIQDDNGEGPSDPLAAAIKYLGPAIEKGMEGQAQAEALQRAPVVTSLQPTPAAPTAASQPGTVIDGPDISPSEYSAAAPAPTHDEQLQINQAFEFFAQRYLATALQLAEQKQDPAGVGQWLARLIGDDDSAVDAVGRVIAQDDMIERLAQYDDAIVAHAAWFDRVADQLAHALWPDTNPLPDPENATKNATKAGFDGNDAIDADEQTEGAPADENTHADVITDAERSNPPRKGHDHDA